MHNLNIIYFFINNINKNYIEIYYNKNIKFFRKILINIALKSY